MLMLNMYITGSNGAAQVTAMVRVAGAGYSTLKCNFWECCDDRWIVPKFDKLASELERSVYGQHLAIEVITRSLRERTRKSHKEQALVLSMHGWTGTGKNYISQFIINSLYRNGNESNFVHLIVATEHSPHKSQVEKHKAQIRSFIEQKVKECPHFLFIFDEVEKMPSGLIDSIMPYVYRFHLNKPDFTKATFLFLSNTAGSDINRKVLEHLIAGHKREELTLQEMEDVIKTAAQEKSLWYTNLLKKDLITAFVPFLPLERKHVKACIIDEMIRQHLDSYVSHSTVDYVNMVADELRYLPKHLNMFSTSGCKRVSEKVNLIFEDILTNLDEL